MTAPPTLPTALLTPASGAPSNLSGDPTTAKEAFQDFVSGTFFKEMMKSMRKMHDKPAYFHGGSAEDIFRAQMDEKVAEDLAREHGGAFADPLFESFASRQLKVKIQSKSA